MITTQLILILFIKIFVFYSVFRILYGYKVKSKLNHTLMTKIGILFFVLHLLISSLMSGFLIHTLFVIMSMIPFLFFSHLHSKWYQRQFYTALPLFLQHLILSMKGGVSFRESYRESLLTLSPCMQSYFRKYYEFVTFSQQEDDVLMNKNCHLHKSFLETMTYIDQNQHQAIGKLLLFKKNILKWKKFRRKSGQIHGQIVAQAIILSLFYGFSFAYSWYEFQLKECKFILFTSLSLYLLGIFAIWLIGTRFKIRI